MSKRAALYARVSTARQEQEQTVASQVAALEGAASDLGVTIDGDRRYIDEGFSGSRLDRPGLDALRDAAADGAIDIVLVYCPDRLARNYVHQQIVLEELTKRGVDVHFVERPIGERAEDRLLMQMQGVIAEYERAKIVERTRRGRMHKVRTGHSLPFSFAPYGYSIVRSSDAQPFVAIDEVQAEHVRAMYRWVSEEGLSARQVAKRLHASGVPTKRQAKRWTHSSAYKVLTNPIYAGTAIFCKRESVEPKRPQHLGAYRKTLKSSYRLRPSSQWIHVPMPAIVDLATYTSVRKQLAQNSIRSPRRTKHEYLLRSLAVCGECGR